VFLTELLLKNFTVNLKKALKQQIMNFSQGGEDCIVIASGSLRSQTIDSIADKGRLTRLINASMKCWMKPRFQASNGEAGEPQKNPTS